MLHRFILLVALALIGGDASEAASVLNEVGEALTPGQPVKQGAGEAVPGAPPKSEDEVIQARASFREQHRFPPESKNLTAAQTREVRLIYEIDITLSEQIDALRQLAKLNLQITNMPPPEKWESVASIPDLSSSQTGLKVLDSLYAIRNNLARSGELARQEIRRADGNLNLAIQTRERAEKRRMDFEERTGAETPDGSIVTDRETAALASQAAEKKLALRRLQTRMAQAELTLIDIQIERFQPFLAERRLKVFVSPEQVREQRDAFSAREAELEESFLAAQEHFARLTAGVSAPAGLATEVVTPGETVRQLAQSYERDAAHERVSLNQLWINHLNIQRQFHDHRVSFYRNKIERRQRAEIARELDLEIQRLKSEEG